MRLRVPSRRTWGGSVHGLGADGRGPVTASTADLEALLARAEEHGCVAESEIAELAESLGLEEDELNDLHPAVEARAVVISDDCARALPDGPPVQTAYTNTDLAVFT